MENLDQPVANYLEIRPLKTEPSKILSSIFQAEGARRTCGATMLNSPRRDQRIGLSRGGRGSISPAA